MSQIKEYSPFKKVGTTISPKTSGDLIDNVAINATLKDKKDLIGNYIISGLIPATSATLTSDISAGTAFVQGYLITVGVTSHTYTASKDTYISLDSAGTYTFSEVENFEEAPAKPANTAGIARVETNTTAIIGVTTTIQNTFVGQNAGFSNTIGTYNTFVGSYAGYSNTAGIYNTFVGSYAGHDNTAGIYNTFVGRYAGFFNTTGNSNTFVGLQAGHDNTTGGQNTFVGRYAGFSNTTAIKNTFVGYGAGFMSAIGSSNVVIGYNADVATDALTNAIAIGAAAIASASNTWQIGVIGIKQVIRGGANAAMGASVLVAGTVTVSNTLVTASSRIFLTNQVAGGTLGILSIGTRVAGTSFVINSSSATDTSTVAWEIKETA